MYRKKYSMIVLPFISTLLLNHAGCSSGMFCPKSFNAEIKRIKVISDPGLGAVQGVVVRDGLVYAYGDYRSQGTHTGVIREYTPDLKYTGRMLKLTKGGISIAPHPTGLTWDREWGTFIGNTVKKKGSIIRFDWQRAWIDLTLDNAVMNIIDDDAASNGTRPVFVNTGDNLFIATADYKGCATELRLYNIGAMISAGRTSAVGVIAYRIKCGQYNQNLYWDRARGNLIFIQNRCTFGGMRLETVKLAGAIIHGTTLHPSAKVSTYNFSDSGELEGWYPADNDVSFFAVNNVKDNLFSGRIRAVNEKRE